MAREPGQRVTHTHTPAPAWGSVSCSRRSWGWGDTGPARPFLPLGGHEPLCEAARQGRLSPCSTARPPDPGSQGSPWPCHPQGPAWGGLAAVPRAMNTEASAMSAGSKASPTPGPAGSARGQAWCQLAFDTCVTGPERRVGSGPFRVPGSVHGAGSSGLGGGGSGAGATARLPPRPRADPRPRGRGRGGEPGVQWGQSFHQG